MIWHRVTGSTGLPQQQLCASRAIFENGAGFCKEINEIGVSDGLLHIFLVCLLGFLVDSINLNLVQPA